LLFAREQFTLADAYTEAHLSWALKPSYNSFNKVNITQENPQGAAKQLFFSQSLPLKILPDLSIRPPGFHVFGFRNNVFFKEQGRQPCVQPPNLDDQVSVFMFPSDKVAQLQP
jgi:hypothetical protein